MRLMSIYQRAYPLGIASHDVQGMSVLHREPDYRSNDAAQCHADRCLVSHLQFFPGPRVVVYRSQDGREW
jgi:hypothetical protein